MDTCVAACARACLATVKQTEKTTARPALPHAATTHNVAIPVVKHTLDEGSQLARALRAAVGTSRISFETSRFVGSTLAFVVVYLTITAALVVIDEYASEHVQNGFRTASYTAYLAMTIMFVPLSVVLLAVAPVLYDRWWQPRILAGRIAGGIRNFGMMVHAYLVTDIEALPAAWAAVRYVCASVCIFLAGTVDGATPLSGTEWTIELGLLTRSEAQRAHELQHAPKHEICLLWAEQCLLAVSGRGVLASAHGTALLMNMQTQLSELRADMTALTRFKGTLPPRAWLINVSLAVDLFSWLVLFTGLGTIVEARAGCGLDSDHPVAANSITAAAVSVILPLIVHLCSTAFLDTVMVLVAPFSTSRRSGLKFVGLWGGAICGCVEIHLSRANELESECLESGQVAVIEKSRNDPS